MFHLIGKDSVRNRGRHLFRMESQQFRRDHRWRVSEFDRRHLVIPSKTDKGYRHC